MTLVHIVGGHLFPPPPRAGCRLGGNQSSTSSSSTSSKCLRQSSTAAQQCQCLPQSRDARSLLQLARTIHRSAAARHKMDPPPAAQRDDGAVSSEQPGSTSSGRRQSQRGLMCLMWSLPAVRPAPEPMRCILYSAASQACVLREREQAKLAFGAQAQAILVRRRRLFSGRLSTNPRFHAVQTSLRYLLGPPAQAYS